MRYLPVFLVLGLSCSIPAQIMKLNDGGAVELTAVLDAKNHVAWKPDGKRIAWPQGVGKLQSLDPSDRTTLERRYLVFRLKKGSDAGMMATSQDQPDNGHSLPSIGAAGGDGASRLFLIHVPKTCRTAAVQVSVDLGKWKELLSFDIVKGKVANAKTNGHWVKVLRVPAGYSTGPAGIHKATPGFGDDHAPERTAIQYSETLPYAHVTKREDLFDLRGGFVYFGSHGGLYGQYSECVYLGKPEQFSKFRVQTRPFQQVTFKSIAMQPH